MALLEGAIAFMTGPFGVAFLTMFTVLSVVAVYVWCRRRCCKPAVNYTAVNHGLDEEEMAFKKSMETQEGDDIDELFNFSGQEELEFDTNDLDNIEMLQAYRSNLTGRANRREDGAETGLGKDDANGRNVSVEANGEDGREVEDLEALLEGGYLDEGGGEAGGKTGSGGGDGARPNGNSNGRTTSGFPPPV